MMRTICLLTESTDGAQVCRMSAVHAFTLDKIHEVLPRSMHNRKDHPWCRMQQLVASLVV